ncbi:Pex19 protein family-domain-containing protein [Scheffersomyces coipomensis]|uniref:Pex19 protein family-domain-containing protein n=1 Tax=Scheffersomyces coipomensis TaxID=1788519 RepID=UPI00315C9B44
MSTSGIDTQDIKKESVVSSEVKPETTTGSEGISVKETTTTTVTATVESGATRANDDDLDDLDDLLDDFADDVLNKPPGSALEAKDDANKSITIPVTGGAEPPTDEFKSGIEELMKDLNIEDDETKGQFESLVKQFELNHREEVEQEEKKPHNFEYVMKETMERLKKSGETVDEKIKNDPSSANPEDMLSQLLAGFGGGPSGGPSGDFDMSKLLVDMLEQLSSKEVLYEPIKDLNTKFPDYLKENKDKISESQYTNYSKQYDITNQILAVFDNSTFDDENKEQRDKVNTLLESLQELGQPPTELVGDSNDFPGFGGLGGLGGGKAGAGAGGDDPFNFDSKDLPPNFEKELEEGCKQQ